MAMQRFFCSARLELATAKSAMRRLAGKISTVLLYRLALCAFGRSGCQDQLVELRETQPVNPAFMINFHFFRLLKQILAFDAFRCAIHRSRKGCSRFAIFCCSLVFSRLMHFYPIT